MRKLTFVVAALLAVLTFGPREASAASFSVDFCPQDSTCPDGVTEASLTFIEDLSTATDLNDYTLIVTITADNTADPNLYLDSIDVTISGAAGANNSDYEALPTLVEVNGNPPGTNWTIDWGKIPNCLNPGGDNSFCTESINAIAGTGIIQYNTTNTFEFTVDLVEAFGALESGDDVNLRAAFFPNGNLSPGGGPLGGSVGGGGGGVVGGGGGGLAPEPTMLAMLGAGLALAGRRLRRKASR